MHHHFCSASDNRFHDCFFPSRRHYCLPEMIDGAVTKAECCCRGSSSEAVRQPATTPSDHQKPWAALPCRLFLVGNGLGGYIATRWSGLDPSHHRTAILSSLLALVGTPTFESMPHSTPSLNLSLQYTCSCSCNSFEELPTIEPTKGSDTKVASYKPCPCGKL
jgi:hypothetical protein